METTMLVIGISGQTGAGKSTLANLLSQRGFGENLEVDAIGHELLADSEVKQALVRMFGPEIIGADGAVCRRSLGRKAFVSEEATAALNSIMHPAMVRMVSERIAASRASGRPSIIVNAALLFSMGLDRLCNRLVYVQADPEVRLRRLVNYRKWAEDSARERLFAQDSLPEIPGVMLVENNGDEAGLAKEADRIALQLLPCHQRSEVGHKHCSAAEEIEIPAGQEFIFATPDPEIPQEFVDYLAGVFAPLAEVAAVYVFSMTRPEQSGENLVVGVLPARAVSREEGDRLSFLILEGVEKYLEDREQLDFLVIDDMELAEIASSVSPQINLGR